MSDHAGVHRTSRWRVGAGAQALVMVMVMVLVMVALSGCGADDDTLTEDALRTRANEICTISAAEIGEAVGSVFGSDEPTPASMQAALDTIVSVSRRDLDDIEALAAPDSIDVEVDALIEEGRAATAEAQGLGFWENDGDPWAETNALAAELGLDVCAAG